jgi:hypothetical protein
MSSNFKREAEEAFVKEVREHLLDWYANCPRAMQFTNKIIKSYKKHFPNDKLF